MRLIHLADPHLSNLDGLRLSTLRGKRWSGYASWRKNRQKKYLPGVLEALCVAVEAERADRILITGDLVQIGLDSEIEQAARWLAGLGPPERVMLVPGNHDTYTRQSIAAVYECWSEYLFQGGEQGRYPVIRKLAGLSLIGLSTACVSPPLMATGTLDAGQLAGLSRLLEQAADEQQMTCLLIHHPPLPGMTKWRKALTNARALQAVLTHYPPALILHGHLHCNREQQWGNSRIFCTAAASSVSDASYRVFDIEDGVENGSVRMTLKSVGFENTGKLRFLTIDEQAWLVPRHTDL